jgi:hypothetical protein
MVTVLPTDTPTHLKAWAVSFSSVLDYVFSQEDFFFKLEYLLRTVPDEEYSMSHSFIDDIVSDARKGFESFVEKLKDEKAALGGNGVFVVHGGAK